MVAYRFKERFVGAIISGAKSQTIRADRQGRARHARAGDELQLYTGPRFKPTLIGRAHCEAVTPIRLTFGANPEVRIDGKAPRYLPPPRGGMVTVGVVMIGEGPLDFFARADGFPNWAHMEHFWREEHGKHVLRESVFTWTGQLIMWRDYREPVRSGQ